MFHKIIVGGEGGRDALALAARLASLFGGELVAVHAYPYDLARGVETDEHALDVEVAAVQTA